MRRGTLVATPRLATLSALFLGCSISAQASYDFILAERLAGGAPDVKVWSSFTTGGLFNPSNYYEPATGTVRAIDGTEDDLGRLYMLVEDPAAPGGAYVIAALGSPFFQSHRPLSFPPITITSHLADTWTDLKMDMSAPQATPTAIVVGHNAQGSLIVTRLLTGGPPPRLVIGSTPVTSAQVAIDQSNGTIYVADSQGRLHTIPPSLSSSSWAPLLPNAVASDMVFSPEPAPQTHPLIISERNPGGLHRYTPSGLRGTSLFSGASIGISADQQGGLYAILDFGVPPNAVVHFDHAFNLTGPCSPNLCVIPSDYTAITWLSRAGRDPYFSPGLNLLGAMALAQPSYVGDTQLSFTVGTNTAGFALGVATGFVLNQPLGLHLDSTMLTIPAPLGAPLLPMVLPVNLTTALNGAKLHWQLIGLVNGQIQTSGMASHMIGYRPVE